MATGYQIGASNWPSQLLIIGKLSVLPSSLNPSHTQSLSRKVSSMTYSGRYVTSADIKSFPISNLDLKFWILAECTSLPSSSVGEILFELLLLKADRTKEQLGRILAYLASAEQDEPDVWLRDDIRIAWITVLYAANDRPTPWEWAFNQVIGGHPSKVIPILVERRRKHAELAFPPKSVTKDQSLAKKAGA